MSRVRNVAALSPVVAVLMLCACSSERSPAANDAENQVVNESLNATPASNGAPVASPVASASPTVIGLEGLGDLRIGEAVPEGSDWAERGGQTGGECRTVTSPRYPGVYAIVERDKVQRITVGQRLDVRLAEGIGVGASEAEARKWFAGFRSEPHKYEAAPAKYLTAPNAPNGSSALRLEIGQDGKVALIHVGLMPALGYVEGCA
ncbi:hypothetical protein SAMIE_1007490 [Sphingobium amiense]|uniref:Uncharacterized protein n=1 Tax=Sphingobium amiense TaxID=135719 RepID=A0A494W264_9SPHN|nr:hypothetical protein [Sphingobium amiense]BBD97248.1 hypothetical protein SAMIE_1007490 [Sphingobium amiense]